MSQVYKNTIKLLKENNISYEELNHVPVSTSLEASKTRSLSSPKSGVKAMIVKDNYNNYFLVLVPGDKKIDFKKIAILENVNRIYLASSEEVEKVSGVNIGRVSPIGLKTKLKVYFDKDILENEFIYFNPGLHEKSIKMKSKDLLKVLKNPILF